LVSGLGDGGLIDIVRLLIRDFQHSELIETLAIDDHFLAYGKGLARVDERSRAAALRKEQFPLLEEYQKIVPSAELEERVRARLEPNAQVIALHRGAEPLHHSPAVLNKALVLLMARLEAVTFMRGRLIAVTMHDGEQVQAACVEPTDASGRYQRVVVRHGPNSEHVRKSLGPGLAEACVPLGGVVAALGLTDSLDRSTDDYFAAIDTKFHQ